MAQRESFIVRYFYEVMMGVTLVGGIVIGVAIGRGM